MIKQPEVTAATKSAFVGAFLILCEETPIERITIQELSNKAGYNRSTFYQYFKGIYDLLTYIEDDMLIYISEHIVEKADSVSIDGGFITEFASIYREKDRQLKVLFGSHNSARFTERLKNEMIPAFAEKLNLQPDNAKTEYILDFYLSGILSVIGRWFSKQKDMPLEELASLIRSIVSNMMQSGLLKNV